MRFPRLLGSARALGPDFPWEGRRVCAMHALFQIFRRDTKRGSEKGGEGAGPRDRASNCQPGYAVRILVKFFIRRVSRALVSPPSNKRESVERGP